MEILPVTAEVLGEVWPRVCEMLDRALPKKPLFMTIDDLREDIEAGGDNLWVAVRGVEIIGAFVTHAMVYRRAKSIKAWLMAGSDMDAWAVPFFDKMKRHARANGCTLLEGCGRRGWVKIYPGLIDMGPSMLALEIEPAVTG